MDPNVTLTALRAHVKLYRTMPEIPEVLAANAERVVELFEALDNFISRGGFFPAEWTEAQRRALENTRVPCPPPSTTAPSTSASRLIDAIQDNLRSNPWRQ